jgi:hypothetical protein
MSPSRAWEREKQGIEALMRTSARLLLITICFSLLWVAWALAGESGSISCTTPGCGYQDNLIIGGGRASPAVAGYCPTSKKFIRLKLKSWADYRKPHYCPGGKERLQPIYSGSQVSRIPCPKCGNLTLKYKRRYLFD